ncbi:MAG: hypothetical protein JAZ03_11695, partial [Candidatus Thiodiazotropha taylori]|nr:hypothetical protein [Candidatus Thiodiazotropha taylori]MCW4334588.1 hypothetical protein [Candidatus Thiodiazotropha endolucinida]
VYASNSVIHMLSGKALSRAVRRHLLVDAALNTMLVANTYNVPVPSKDTDEQPEADKSQTAENKETCSTIAEPDLSEIRALYDGLMSGSTTKEEACSSEVLKRVVNKMKTEQNSMSSRTATLWLQYMEMVDILRRFLKAERTGNWALHLQSVHDMLPYFAASGHNLYAKSAYLYLQMMQALPETHPELYDKFTQGFHVVRRSDRYWAGLSTDLIIEQVLMRSVKTSGGLTRGRGMTET